MVPGLEDPGAPPPPPPPQVSHRGAFLKRLDPLLPGLHLPDQTGRLPVIAKKEAAMCTCEGARSHWM